MLRLPADLLLMRDLLVQTAAYDSSSSQLRQGAGGHAHPAPAGMVAPELAASAVPQWLALFHGFTRGVESGEWRVESGEWRVESGE